MIACDTQYVPPPTYETTSIVEPEGNFFDPIFFPISDLLCELGIRTRFCGDLTQEEMDRFMRDGGGSVGGPRG